MEGRGMSDRPETPEQTTARLARNREIRLKMLEASKAGSEEECSIFLRVGVVRANPQDVQGRLRRRLDPKAQSGHPPCRGRVRPGVAGPMTGSRNRTAVDAGDKAASPRVGQPHNPASGRTALEVRPSPLDCRVGEARRIGDPTGYAGEGRTSPLFQLDRAVEV